MLRKKKGQTVSFIRFIEQWPMLYDRSDESFGNLQLKSEKWEEIARLFRIDDAETARNKWKNLIDTRRRSRKLISSGRKRKPFVYTDDMAFLDRLDQSRLSPVNEDSKDFFQLVSLDQVASTSSPDSPERDEQQQDSNFSQITYDTPAPNLQATTLANFESTSVVTATANPIYTSSIFSSSASQPYRDETASDAFGRMIALTLNRMEPKMRARAQVEIQNVLFKCEFGDES